MNPTETNEKTREFQNVTLYLAGMFGVHSTTCKTLKITTGVNYAQYTDAIRMDYLEKGKRKPCWRILDYKPWLRVLATKDAITPDDPLIPASGGGKVTRYCSFDPRYVTEFEDKLGNVEVLYFIGFGDRKENTNA